MISWTGKFNTIQKVSRSSENFSDYPETFQTIQKLSRPSRNFPHHPETFQTIRKVSKPSGNFPDHMETFQSIWKLSRPSWDFPDHPDTFHTIWKSVLWACLLIVDFLDTRKNFPDAQKLSRWQCHHATWVFLTLDSRPVHLCLRPPNQALKIL